MENQIVPRVIKVTPKAVKEHDAAAYIGMSVAYLRQSRMQGNRHNHTSAPPFVKAGKAVIYRVADLDAWLEENLIELSMKEA